MLLIQGIYSFSKEINILLSKGINWLRKEINMLLSKGMSNVSLKVTNAKN